MSPSFPSPSPSPNVSVPNRPQPSPHPVFGILGYQPRSRFFFEKFSVLFLISVFLGFSVFSRFFCLKLEFSRFVMIKLVFSRFCFWKFLGFIFNLDFSHVFFYLFSPFFFLEISRFFFSKIRSLIFFPQKFFSIFKNFFRFFFLFFWFFLGFLVFFVFVPWPWPSRLRPVTVPSPFFRTPSLLRPPCVPRVKRSFSVPKRSLIYDA